FRSGMALGEYSPHPARRGAPQEDLRRRIRRLRRPHRPPLPRPVVKPKRIAKRSIYTVHIHRGSLTTRRTRGYRALNKTRCVLTSLANDLNTQEITMMTKDAAPRHLAHAPVWKPLRHLVHVVVLLAAVVHFSQAATEKDNKKEMEQEAKALIAQAKTLEQSGDLLEARAKFAESEAFIETRDALEGVKRVDK